MKSLLPFLLVFTILTAGCGQKDGNAPDAGTVKTAGDDLFPWPTDEVAKIATLFGESTETSTGMRGQPITPGEGDSHPRKGEIVIAHYRGTLLDGTVFDESYKRGEPIRFPIGRGRVIKGWDEAILGMTKGEKRLLVIPYWLAYGEAGRLPTIPERATLVFEVELMGWDGAPQ
jgi:peptidylprolyl isomerase